MLKHSNLYTLLIALLSLGVAIGCSSPNNSSFGEQHNRYATGFSITYSAEGDTSAYLFRSKMRCRFGDTLFISDSLLVLPHTPRRIICLSSTHIAFLKVLDELNTVVGLGGMRYVSDSILQDAIRNGKVLEVGELPDLNYERIIALAPDLVLGYDADITAVSNYANRLHHFKIPLISIDEYHEEHPLGRAEWLKFFAFLFHKDNIASLVLDTVNGAYEAILAKTNREHTPKVLINYPWKELWYIPTQNSYMAQWVQDAGGSLLLSSEGEGSTAKAVAREQVLWAAQQAEFWLNPGVCETLSDLGSLQSFPAVRQHKVYNNTKRCNSNGGNDFYESGVLLPHLILRDLQTILHPPIGDTVPPLIFYKQLQ